MSALPSSWTVLRERAKRTRELADDGRNDYASYLLLKLAQDLEAIADKGTAGWAEARAL